MPILIMILFLVTAYAEDTTAIVQKIVASDTKNADLSFINDGNRDEIIRISRAINSGKIGGNGVGAKILLLRLGDPQTIQEMMTEFSAYKTRAAWEGFSFYVERARQPLLVEAFTKELYAPLDQGIQGMQGNPKNGAVIEVYPKPIMAAASILWTIESSKEFSLELRRWAYEIDRGYPLNKQPLLLQKWWEKNKEKLQAHRYGEVEPLHEPAPAATKTGSQ